MAILTRLARLLKADLHALLDRMEAPDVLLQQSLREMEAAVLCLEQEQQQRQQQHANLQRQIRQLQEQTTHHAAELSLCLDTDNDELARTLLRRQLEAEQLRIHLHQQRETLQAQLESAATELLRQQNSLRSLRTQAECLMPIAEEPRDGSRDVRPMISDADIELALLKAKRERQSS